MWIYSCQLPQLIPPGSSSLMDVHKKEMKKITTNQKSSLTSSKLAQYAQEPILQNIQDSDYCTQTRLLALDSIAGIVTPIYYKVFTFFIFVPLSLNCFSSLSF